MVNMGCAGSIGIWCWGAAAEKTSMLLVGALLACVLTEKGAGTVPAGILSGFSWPPQTLLVPIPAAAGDGCVGLTLPGLQAHKTTISRNPSDQQPLPQRWQ